MNNDETQLLKEAKADWDSAIADLRTASDICRVVEAERDRLTQARGEANRVIEIVAKENGELRAERDRLKDQLAGKDAVIDRLVGALKDVVKDVVWYGRPGNWDEPDERFPEDNAKDTHAWREAEKALAFAADAAKEEAK